MIPIFPEANYTDCTGKTAVEQFEKFFDEQLLSLIVKESSKYAEYLDKPDPKITIEELKVYIGILVVSGYSVQSRLESYWSPDPDLRNELVCQSMRKNRFKKISQFLHFKDMNEPDASDKLWKLRPITDDLKKKFLSNFHPQQSLSYDESMIEYFGKHGMKQCLKAKPSPFGYKCWSLCTVSGYLVNFEIYQGKNSRSTSEYETKFGKCMAPLFSMIDDFDDNIRDLPYSFYFDNLFTSIRALTHLKNLGYNGTGTIRENRLPEGCPLKEKKKETVKRGRGYMASKTIENLNIHLTQWVDNSVVRVASTVFGMKPVTPALRYSSVEKKKVEVPRPLVVTQYNKCMGGVDRMDQNVSLYRINIHGKKWWSCIFTWMIDVSIQNAWQLHRVAHPEMPQLDFRREIALYYCRHYGVPPKSTGNRKRKMEKEDYASLRYDNLRHWPRQTAKRRRCALETCQSSIRTMCVKCDVGLCVNCFEPYHSLQKFKE
ncbi:piggyBac transposable element-derived protein 2-like [Bradysia coprophila]|uniref:piggyBac transposable element-derived protein 2-like n=1 Tax=Bradysia coprophila TaxID=38358 RepID=UPI00187DAC43|nr:piggyBac transposable element-derived protein 2-like [Bradysia coprophila]